MTSTIKATIQLEGSPEDVAQLLPLLYERGDVHLSVHPEQFLPVDWKNHPVLERLTNVERQIMQLDLVHEPRRRIAEKLELTVGTITVYRRTIRAKLRLFPSEQHPMVVREWLRCFPGQPGAAFRRATEPPATPEAETPAAPEDPSV